MGITENIKDRNNLANYQKWSCGDYGKNTTGFTSTQGTLTLSDYCTIGDYSLHLTRNENADPVINTYIPLYIGLTNGDVGKTISVSADIYTPNNITTLQIVQNNNYFNITCPSNNKFQKITLCTEVQNTDHALININIFKEQDCYVDNITIIIL